MSARTPEEAHALLVAAFNGGGHMATADGTEMDGGATVVSRRQADGSWRIVLDDPLSAR